MKSIKKITAVILAVSSVFLLCGCVKKNQSYAMTLGDKYITENEYQYRICSYKGTFMTSYSDMSDSDEFWEQVLYDGVTAESFLSNLVNEYVKMDLVTRYLFGEYGLELSSDDRESAKNIVSDLCDDSGGGKNAFNQVLSQYGVNMSMLEEIYLEEYKSTYVYNHVFENNILTVTDTEKQAYLEDNYSRIRHIYINNAYASSSYDEDGNLVLEPLDDETQAAQDKKVEEAKAALEAGSDFDEVYEEYSEEKSYPNGYYLCSSTEGLPNELITNAFAIEIGETKAFETDYGVHIIKRLEMDESPWENEANEDFFEDFKDDVYEDVFMDFIRTYFDEIEVNTEVIDSISIRDALPNYSYQY